MLTVSKYKFVLMHICICVQLCVCVHAQLGGGGCYCKHDGLVVFLCVYVCMCVECV